MPNLLASEDVRLWNLRYLADTHDGITRFAKRLKRPQPMLSAYIGKKPIKRIGREFCAYVEAELGLEPHWCDQPHPERWRRIENPTWNMLVSRILDEQDAQPLDDNPIEELMESAQQLSDEDKQRLLDFARILSR